MGFRGFTAPASLKRRSVVMSLRPPLTGFPGLYRPGLIEALIRADQISPIRRGFRGFTAPASLKLNTETDADGTDDLGFRGFTAPASLKREQTMLTSIMHPLVSGALPPRPH